MKNSKYRISGRLKTGKRFEGHPCINFDYARNEAEAKKNKFKVLTIEQEDTGEFCAENKGKWFLHQIVK